MRKRAIYVRVSTEDQTLEQQVEEVRKAMPVGDDGLLYDEQLSGWHGKRPEWERLKKDIERGRISEVWAFSISRLGRNVQEALYFARICIEHEISLRIVSSGLDFSGKFGTALFMLFSELAAMESDNKSAAIKAKFAYKRKQDPDWKMHGNVKGVVATKVKEKSEEILRMSKEGRSFKYISRMLGIDERAVAKVVKLTEEGKPIMTRLDYSIAHPEWHLANKAQ